MADSGVKIEDWGRDHWSTFGFVAHWCMEYGNQGFSIADKRANMRTDADLHPHFVYERLGPHGHAKYPTRLRDGLKLADHDDWSCVDDMEAAGLIRDEGTGIRPVIFMTDEGLEVAAQLNEHKTRGGNWGNFVAVEDKDVPGTSV